MAHVTQCPACSTRFRVVDDQLKISDGWVRCGRCGEVFDARQALVAHQPLSAAVPADPSASALPPSAPWPSATLPIPVPAPAVLQVTGPPVQQESAAAELGLDIVIGEDGVVHEALTEPMTAAVTEAAPPESSDSRPAAAAVQPEAHTPDLVAAWTHPEVPEPAATLPAVGEGVVGGSVDVAESASPMGEHPAGDGGGAGAVVAAPSVLVGHGQALASDVSFLRAARREAFWRTSSVRSVLAALAVLLGLALPAQVVWLERERVAAAAPGLKPWLAAVCQPLGCEVGHWRRIEAVRLEGTALVRLKDGGYRLEVGLNNTASLPVALPALELSLTNARDEVVLRRVILPSEWANPTDVLPPSGTLTLSVNLAVAGPDTLATAGYRALVFYP